MKSVLLTLALAFSAQSFAFVSVPSMPTPSDYPVDWALGMVSIACGIPAAERKVLSGEVEPVQGGYLFSAVDANGMIVYQSTAPNQKLSGTLLYGKCLD